LWCAPRPLPSCRNRVPELSRILTTIQLESQFTKSYLNHIVTAN
jgi:hypothetical protein